MAAMKAEVISRETIKPSSPTPPNLQTFKLSRLDQFAPAAHFMLVLFYTSGGAEISQSLKKSLSEILTRYYPLAGRIKDHSSVDCNDHGADFIEARINRTISDVLQQPSIETLNNFVPSQSFSNLGSTTSPLLIVQATFLECGGTALGVSMSHKIAEAATMTAFIKAWASAAALGSPDTTPPPDFTAVASRFPPTDQSPIMPPFTMDKMRFDGIIRRYVFVSSKIAALKAKAASVAVPSPTRVEAVSALIWKCAMNTTRSRLGSPIPSVLKWAVNIRKILEPPPPENYFGNMFALVRVGHVEKESEADLPELVRLLRGGVEEFRRDPARKLEGDGGMMAYFDEWTEMDRKLRLISGDVDMHGHSSWCRLPYYESDFGWGKPIWAGLAHLAGILGMGMLLDTKDGEGVEAWVTLAPEDLALFETNQELLAFASLNPCPLN